MKNPVTLRHATVPLGISRRNAIVLTMGGLAAIASPFRVSAEPITTAAVVAIVAAVVGIVSGIAGMVSDAKLRQGMDSILGQLNIVIANQELILQELRDMKIYFDEALFASWQSAYARSIVAYNAQLRVCRNALEDANWKVDARLKEDLESLSSGCFHTTIEIGQMNVWAFPSFASGVAVVLLADAILKTKSNRTSETKASFRQRIEVWLDPKADHSLASLSSKTTKDIGDRTQALNARPRSYVTRNEVVRWQNVDELCSERQIDTVAVAGSLDAGFTGAITTTSTESRCRVIGGGRGGLRNLSLDLEKLDASLSPSAGVPLEMSGPSTSVPVVPLFNPSGYAIVDVFNQERVAIYELQAALFRQEKMLAYMEKMHRTLA